MNLTEIIKITPSWIIAIALFLFSAMMIVSYFAGTPFIIADKQFGYKDETKIVEKLYSKRISSLEEEIKQLQFVIISNKKVNDEQVKINKKRTLSPGQAWNEESIGFSFYFKSLNGSFYKDSPDHTQTFQFEIEIKTPETNKYSANVKKGWIRQFAYNNKSFIVKIESLNPDDDSMTVSLVEQGKNT